MLGEDRLYFGYSGGAGSSILADVVRREYLDTSLSVLLSKKRQGVHKPPNWRASAWNKAYIAYVDMSAAVGTTNSDYTHKIKQLAKYYPQYTLVTLRIQDAFDLTWWQGVTGQTLDVLPFVCFTSEGMKQNLGSLSPGTALRSFLDTLSPSTVVMALQQMRRVLLLYTAESLGCSHMLLGDSITSLSMSLLSAIASGGGHALQHEQSEQWKHVQILRPVTDLTTKECAAWIHWNYIPLLHSEPVTVPELSIQHLTAGFVHHLGAEYPSAIFTIARTCNKVGPSFSPLLCAFCQRPRSANMRSWRLDTAIRSRGPSSTISPMSFSVTSHLCYPCQTSFCFINKAGGIGSSVPFPVWTSTDG